MADITIRQYIENFNNGDYDSPDIKVQCDAGWYDWFCKDSSLRNKTYSLTKKLLSIIDSPLFDIDKTYVFFKNNCPMSGSLYDDFRICDMESGDVLFTIIPSCGHNSKKGMAEVWGKKGNNDFGDIVSGTWKDVKNYFNKTNIHDCREVDYKFINEL